MKLYGENQIQSYILVMIKGLLLPIESMVDAMLKSMEGRNSTWSFSLMQYTK